MKETKDIISAVTCIANKIDASGANSGTLNNITNYLGCMSDVIAAIDNADKVGEEIKELSRKEIDDLVNYLDQQLSLGNVEVQGKIVLAFELLLINYEGIKTLTE